MPVPSNTVEEPTPLDAFSGTLSGLESALTVPVLLLILAGILTPRRWRHRRPRRGRGLLVATAGVLVALVVRLQLGWGYGGGRHLLVAGTLLLPFGGAGLFVLAGWFPGVRSRRRFAFFAALILMIPLGLRAVLRPPGQGGVAARQLGREVATAAAADDDLVIASVAEPRVAYYARRTAGPGARVRDLPLWGPFVRPLELGADVDQVVARLVDAVREEHVDWVVLDLWRERASGPGPEFPQRVLYEELLARGVIERRALGAGSGLAAFRVVRGIRER